MHMRVLNDNRTIAKDGGRSRRANAISQQGTSVLDDTVYLLSIEDIIPYSTNF